MRPELDHHELSRVLTFVLGALTATAILLSGVYDTPPPETQRLNDLAEDLHTADRPDKAFQSLEQRLGEKQLLQTGETTGVKQRFRLASNALLDAATTHREILKKLPENSKKPELEGLYTASCTRHNLQDICLDRDSPYFTNQAAALLTYAQEIRGLDELRGTEAWKHLRNYTERARYYDARLSGFSMNKIQTAVYTDTGLYIIGGGEKYITIDGERHLLRGEPPLQYTPVELEPGNHIIQRGLERAVIKVVPDIPQHGEEDGELVVENTTHYTTVQLKGDQGTTSENLSDTNTTRIRIPSSSTGGEHTPYWIKFISPEINATITEGTEFPGYSRKTLYTYGMTPTEYTEARRLMDRPETDLPQP